MTHVSPFLGHALSVLLVLVAALHADDLAAQELFAEGALPALSEEASAATDFADLFEHIRTVTVEGTEEQPIYRLTSLAVHDTLIAVIDQSAHTLTVLGESGDIHFQVGGEGDGLGQLSNPDWVGFDAGGRILVKEWHANHRVQIFRARDGRSEGGFLLQHGSVPSGQAFIEGDAGQQRLLFVTSVPCTGDEARYCVVQEQTLTGVIVRRFGPMDEIAPEHEGQPFVMGRDERGQTFLAHRYGGEVSVYNAEGVRIDRFRIDGDTDMHVLDVELLAEASRGQNPMLQDEEFTIIRALNAVGDHLVIMHYRSYEAPHHFLSVFDQSGQLLGGGIEADVPLHHAVGDRFYFVEEDLDASYGSYLIHEYRYDPQALE